MNNPEDDIFGAAFGSSGLPKPQGAQAGFTFDTEEMNPFGDANALWDDSPAVSNTADRAGVGAEKGIASSDNSESEDTSSDRSKDTSSDRSKGNNSADEDYDVSVQLSQKTDALKLGVEGDDLSASAAKNNKLDAHGQQREPKDETRSDADSAASAAKKPPTSGYMAQPAVQTVRRVGVIKRGLKSPRVLGKQLSPASFIDPLSSVAATDGNDGNGREAMASEAGSNGQPANRASVDAPYQSPHSPLSSRQQTRQTRSMSEARRRSSMGNVSDTSSHRLSISQPHPYDQQLSPVQQEEQVLHAQQHTERPSTASTPSTQASSRPSMSAPGPSRTSTSRTYLGTHQRRRSLDPTPIAQIPEFSIAVTEPVKVSDSLKSYIAYKVRTQSDAPMFRDNDMVVRRRYRDFDWLIQELVARHPGIIVPAIPEKQSMGRFEDEFVEARRSGLESCLHRISEHPVLWCDDVFRLFLEADDFPTKARIITENRIAAEINGTGPPLSGSSASSSSLFGDGWGGSKYKEKDEWFAKRMQELDAIEEELKALLRALEYSQKQRRELSIAHGELGEAYLKMAGQELSKSLSNGLTDMGSLQQKLRVLQSRQGVADFAAFQLTTDEYIRMISAVRTAFSARGRAYILWQNSLADLIKRRKVLEGFVQHPSRANPDRILQLKAEIARAEIKTEAGRNAFDDVSLILKREIARFDVCRVRDFQTAIEAYLLSLIETQEEIVSLWETYLASLAGSDSANDSTTAKLFSRRELNDSRFKNVRTAILVVNGNPTTCEVGLVSPNIGIFASGCLVLDKEGYRDEDAQYGVYVYEGDGSDEPIKYYPDTSEIQLLAIGEDVTWHANLAAIRYRKDSNDTYMPYVSINSYYIDDSSYSLRALDFDTDKWREAEVEQQLDDPQDQCSEYNRLYKSNYFMFSCNNQTVESVYDSNCRMPYGALYTIKDDKVALVAIYTHSVILGYDECIDPRLNYYTYVWPFIQFASWIFEEPIYAYNENASETVVSVSDRPDIVIDAGSPNTIISVRTVSADLYARYQSKETSSSETDSESTHSSNSSDDMSLSGSKSTETDTGPDSDLDTDGSSSSNTAKVVAGAVVSVVTALTIVAFLVYRWLKRRRNNSQWNPHAESMNVYSIANNLNTDVPHIKPPSYSQVQAEEMVSVPRVAPNFRAPE
ncbi:Vacuolar protein sorting-associated protein vps5 [Coemansia sp. RSA 1721]|nr:Vacuolar protein sorting-associated protein vps5 [Coemansia sp. RSA 1721]